ncbi:MAG: sigma-70 family RNA polymerase sigma factor, partial [Lachnospiraceae bacterium]|nr:sigma-70 family RNA polymerase sigma factor [Lachnospiraceae bacterium]
EKQLRSLGVSEDDIEKLRVHDWAIFNSDRRYYEKLQDAGTNLEEVAEYTAQPEIKTVEEILDSIENAVLYQELHQLDKLTLQALLMRTQGFSVTEISVELSLNL